MSSFPYRYGDPVVELRNISLRFGKKPAGKLILRDVNAVVKDVIRPETANQGQVVAILGPSGRGKTMLAEIMAGLRRPIPDEVEITGEVLLNKEKKPVKRGEVGFVFQNYESLDWRTVWGNLYIGAIQKQRSLERRWWKRPPMSPRWHADRKNAKERAEAIMERFKLTEYRKMYPAQLSGGTKQRMAIAQQLLCSDHFIILDEPLSGLDPMIKEEVAGELQEVALMDELNTLFVITHDVHSAVCVADTIWLLGWQKDPADPTGRAFLPGSTIVKTWNLIDEGLAWYHGITRTPQFMEFSAMIEQKEFKGI